MTKLYSTIFNLIALSLVIYIGVDLFYRVLQAQLSQVDSHKIVTEQIPEFKKQTRPPLNAFQVIMDRNIFGSLQKVSEGLKATDIEALEPTSLKIALLGTVTGNQKNAVAVIEETDKRKQGLYRVGDSVQNGILKMILRGKVVLRVGDRDEVLTMEESSSRRASPRESGREQRISRAPRRGATITLRRSEIERSLGNINTLLSQVRIRPHFKDGRADGLALSHIRANSIFAKLGLRDGDIIKGVDRRSIESPDDILSFYRKLRSGSQISLQIDRRGRQRTLNYRLR